MVASHGEVRDQEEVLCFRQRAAGKEEGQGHANRLQRRPEKAPPPLHPR